MNFSHLAVAPLYIIVSLIGLGYYFLLERQRLFKYDVQNLFHFTHKYLSCFTLFIYNWKVMYFYV